MAVLVLSVLPMIMAVSTGGGVGINITSEEFVPLVWMCDHRVVYDDATEPGRMSPDGTPLVERMNNYAFEGEQIEWKVLVMDKNGIEKIKDVYATIGEGVDSQGEGNNIEVNCQESSYHAGEILDSCNARIDEEILTEWDSNVMRYYKCTLTVETPEGMPSNEYWVTVEAEDLDEEKGTMAENEWWYFNPSIALSIDTIEAEEELKDSGILVFDTVRPGTSSYSNTLLVGNYANPDSGVRLDMFISGTDFYDTESSGAMCPTTNQLSLDRFSYYATHGAYSTSSDARADAEGYVPIGYGIGFNNPNPFYDEYEIMQTFPKNGPYYQSNILSPGAEMALTFRLDLPEPCNGDFNDGSIYFWGEAI